MEERQKEYQDFLKEKQVYSQTCLVSILCSCSQGFCSVLHTFITKSNQRLHHLFFGSFVLTFYVY